jgi:pseudouridine-5'-phosphate glycosidase
MATAVAKTMHTAARLCRTVAVALIGGVRRRLGDSDTEARIAELSLRDQAVIVSAALALLFGFAILAAQAGWIGMAVFWLAVILLVE